MKKQFHLGGMTDGRLWSTDHDILIPDLRGDRAAVEAYALRSLMRWGVDRIRIIPRVHVHV